jgi:twitching motility protein PilT
MALVDSLLSAMVRADGDALVMHVGERPYVVTQAGTLDLSTHGLNLGAMTGMLQQLLPADAQNSLEEFGAVEHRLPSVSDDHFTLVAARGGDDIWIEIRRRRSVPVEAASRREDGLLVEPPAPVAESVAVHEEAPASASAREDSGELRRDLAGAASGREDGPVHEEVAAPEPLPAPELPMAPVVAEVEAPSAFDREDSSERWRDLDVATSGREDGALEIPAQAARTPDPVEAAELVAAVEPVEPVDPVEPAAAEPEMVAADASASAREDSGELRRDLADLSAEASAQAEAASGREGGPVKPAYAHAPSVVIPMTRTVRIEVPSRLMPQSRTSTVERLLRIAAARGASSLFLTSESRPYIRVEGDIRLLDGEAMLSKAEVEAAVMEIVPEEVQESVGRGEATEWIAEVPELGRIRCTSSRDHRGPGVVFTMIATRAATAEQLGLPREIQALATEAEGLVLVAGSRGSGKSTLMSALVDLVNRQRSEYVITLERQIRLVHDNRAALVSQREIRGDADDALAAARAALRENPDVLVVDDLSSAQMVPILVEAAAEGLLVFVSITAPSTADAVERLIDLASPDMRTSVQAAMAETFRGAVSQVMLKKTGGGRVVAREIMLATSAVTRLIGDGQFGQLPLALESGRRHGMMPMTDVLVGLVQTGVVDVREAFRKTHDRDRLLAGLKREGVDTSVVERLA